MQAQRPSAKTFRDLLVWQKAHEFVLEVYRYTESFPQREIYGLVQQMRKAAVSIPANVAEGFKRRGKADKARFMNIAEGSLEESRYYLAGTRPGLRQSSRRKDASPGGSEPAAECICQGDSGFWLLTPCFYSAAFSGISRAQPLTT